MPPCRIKSVEAPFTFVIPITPDIASTSYNKMKLKPPRSQTSHVPPLPSEKPLPLLQMEPQQAKNLSKEPGMRMEDEIMQDIEILHELEPKKRSVGSVKRMIREWRRGRDHRRSSMDAVAWKSCPGQDCSQLYEQRREQILAAAGLESVQRCTGIKRGSKMERADVVKEYNTPVDIQVD